MPKAARIRILQSFCDARNLSTPLNPGNIVDVSPAIAEDWIRLKRAETAPPSWPTTFIWEPRALRPYEEKAAEVQTRKYGRGQLRPVVRPEATESAMCLLLSLPSRKDHCEQISKRLKTFYPNRPDLLAANESVLQALRGLESTLAHETLQQSA